MEAASGSRTTGRAWGPGVSFTLPVDEGAAQRRGGTGGACFPPATGVPPGLGRLLVVKDAPQVLWHLRNTQTLLKP